MATPIRLLMLEDNPYDAELVLHALRRAGFDPTAKRVETEQDYREHLQPAPEMILADFSMPAFDSLRAFEILKESRLDIPFIIVSGTIGEERAVQVMQRGVTDYIIKDRLGRLGQAVTQALEQKRLREAQRRTDQALCESEELLRHAFDYTNMAMVVSGLNHRFLRANDAFVNMFGYSHSEILKLSTTDITHPDDLAESHARLNALSAGEVRYVQIEKRYLHKDGHVLWGLVNVSLVHDVHGKPLHFVGQLQDITERVAAEQALRQSQEKSKSLEEQFRQAQKMEAVGQLAAGVAHDFNNLLTIIMGYSELLLISLPAADPSRDSMGQIRKAAERASALTRQLLAFGRKQILSPVVLDLNSLLTEIEKMLCRLIGADIELTTTLQPGLGHVKVDPGQVEQTVMNLVINARDAMPAGGRLNIRTSNTDLTDLQARQHAELPPGPYALLAVSDTGGGMDEATKARIFEPFFTTKEVGKGTGLGLATVFGIVQQSGGFLEVDSTLGSGSTFRIYFPLIRDAVGRKEPDLGLVRMPRGGETILIVEDEGGVLELAQVVLEASGYKILIAKNGGEAVRVCFDYADPIHLLFTDVVMPKMSGRQLADLLAPSRPGMKVLFMSGYTDDTMLRHGIEDSGTNFLPKPFRPVILAQKVREVLDGTIAKQGLAVAGHACNL